MPKISVIVPVYNSEKTLERCITSILSQTFNDFELILINDGSTDRSAEICENFKNDDDRIIAVHNSNHGVSFTRNIGLELSKGDFVTFIDSDDYISKVYLENLYVNKSDFTITGYSTVDYNENIRSENKYTATVFATLDKIDWFSIFKGNMLHTPFAKLFDNRIVKKHNLKFDTRISCGEDTVFVVDYLKHIRNLVILDKLDYFYVVAENNSSLSTKLRPNILDEVSYSKEYCIDFFTLKCPERASEIANIYHNMVCWLCIGYLQNLFSNKTISQKEKIDILSSFLKNKYMQLIVKNPTKFLHKEDPITICLQKKSARSIIKKYKYISLKNSLLNWLSRKIFRKLPKSVRNFLKSKK